MDYKNGKVYTIRSHQTDAIYVGSTCSPLHKRFSHHKTSSNKTSSKQIIDLGDAYIELYEEFPCDNVHQLRKREGEVIRSMNCVNRYVAGNYTNEWGEDNKEFMSKYNKKKYQNNKRLALERLQKCYEALSRIEASRQYPTRLI